MAALTATVASSKTEDGSGTVPHAGGTEARTCRPLGAVAMQVELLFRKAVCLEPAGSGFLKAEDRGLSDCWPFATHSYPSTSTLAILR
jgi:hypothetical protein